MRKLYWTVSRPTTSEVTLLTFAMLLQAAILQQTAEYIYQLEQEKTSLLSQNCQLKRLVNQHEGQHDTAAASATGAKKRKLDTSAIVAPVVSESSDEGIGSMSPEPVQVVSSGGGSEQDPSREMIELRVQLDRERRVRLHLEDQVRSLEHQLYPERIREITQQVHLQYHHQEVRLAHWLILTLIALSRFFDVTSMSQ